MLKGSPTSPRYTKERAPSLVNQLGTGDLSYNALNGSGWSYWTQTDWSGGFQALKFVDNASFKDGQAIDTIKKYGEATLQYGWSSAGIITGSHSYGAHGLHDADLLFGTIKSTTSGLAKVFKLTSGNSISTLSAYNGISAVNVIERFGSNSLIGLTRNVASGSLKTLAKYNGSAISAFRSANPVVRSVKSVGIRAYTSERVASTSGDMLYYSTDLTTFSSAYFAGKNKKIKPISELAGSPYFFVVEGRKVDLMRWDEFAERAYPIYNWPDLTNFGVRNYLSNLVITGTSSNKKVAFAFNGARLWQIFDDQLLDSSYDFSKPFEFEGNLQVKGATWDGEFWFPGIYGQFNAANKYTPLENFANKAYGYFTSGTHTRLGYRDTTKYNISGHIVSSEFGSNIAGVDKLLNSVDINVNALATGQTVEVLRSTDGGSNFTSVGKVSYAQDGAALKKTLFFPSGFVTKLWNYKVQLAGPGTSTPTLNDVTFQYRPITDLKKRWTLAVNAEDNIQLLNNQREQRDSKALMQELWLELEAKRTVVYEDVDSFEVSLVSAMTSAATSARVADTANMPPKGRMRVRKNNAVEEMTYTSADGGNIKGIARGQKSTLQKAYISGDKIDNFYNVLVTDMREAINKTDQNKTESVAQVVLLEV
jgi:hypothetical protein